MTADHCCSRPASWLPKRLKACAAPAWRDSEADRSVGGLLLDLITA